MTVTWNASATKELKAAAMLGIVSGTDMVRTEVLRLILRTRKTGRIYVRRGIRHRASAPGEAPASDTGRLVGSIVATYDYPNLTGFVNAGTKYARFLEYGTRKMAPRPFMRPAMANKRKQVIEAIAKEVDRVIRSRARAQRSASPTGSPRVRPPRNPNQYDVPVTPVVWKK